MQTRNFPFSPNFNFGTDNLMVSKSVEYIATFPPIIGNFELLNGTEFLLLDSTNFLLL